MSSPFSSIAATLAALFAADAGAPAPVLRLEAPRLAPPSLLVGPLSQRPRAAPEAEDCPLHPAKDGSGDLLCQTSAFRARVAPDGTVTFTNRHLSNVAMLPFVLIPSQTNLAVPSLQSSIGSLVRRRRPEPPPPPDPGSPPDETTQLIPNISRYHADTRDGCKNCGFTPDLMPADVAGRMDVTDELERLAGHDPHRVRKARFLTATREMRAHMAARTHATNIKRASAELPSLLELIACDDRLSRRDRRAILEALRDEMDTQTAPGRAAATAIVRFLSTRFDPPDAGAPMICPPPGDDRR